MKINIGKKEKYQRLFQTHAMPFIISDIFMGHYKRLECLTVFKNNTWTTYLPKLVVERTLNDGLRLYKSQRFFLYYSDFEKCKRLSSNFFKKLTKKKEITKKELSKFLKFTVIFFKFYVKTEFFYTDKAFLQSKNNKIIENNLQELECLKNSSREYLNKVFFGDKSYINRMLGILSKQFDVVKDDLQQYSRKELLGLFNNKQINKQILKNRKKSFTMKGDGRKIFQISGEEAELIISHFLSQAPTKKIELRGMVANKGKIIGEARVISADYENFDQLKYIIKEMKKGEILIAETTSPELMIACEKAGAIVTNQGGLISHAAIVSRELKIPCIVGTGNATDLFKDGDLVEVDANEGMVRLLKRK